MKKFKNINLMLITILLILLVYNCFNRTIIENIENSCPTKEQLEKLEAQNNELSKKVSTHEEKINDQNNAIQDAKMQNVKDFCNSARDKFEELNNKVKSIINSMKNPTSNKQ